ncbi:MAG: hypothetical protein MZW92_09100 [Comamonadaceae bacterium]|nr:hypothetical protein [Comamonadaceae bacterium]
MLARFTLIDYDREMALVAVVKERTARRRRRDGRRPQRIVGVSRYITNPDQCQLRVLAGGGRRLRRQEAWARA